MCYAVFTSGSSGTPKLAGVRHAGWFNLLEWMRSEFGLHRGSHNVVASAFGFDLSQRSLLLPLFCGATQHLVASRNVDIARTYRVLVEKDIRTLNCASSTLYLIIDWERAAGQLAHRLGEHLHRRRTAADHAIDRLDTAAWKHLSCPASVRCGGVHRRGHLV